MESDWGSLPHEMILVVCHYVFDGVLCAASINAHGYCYTNPTLLEVFGEEKLGEMGISTMTTEDNSKWCPSCTSISRHTMVPELRMSYCKETCFLVERVLCQRLRVLSQINRHWRLHVDWLSLFQRALHHRRLRTFPARYMDANFDLFGLGSDIARNTVGVTVSSQYCINNVLDTPAILLRYYYFTDANKDERCPFRGRVAQWVRRSLQVIRERKRPSSDRGLLLSWFSAHVKRDFGRYLEGEEALMMQH